MSEPIFEASVRLQADVSDFEKQAQASVQRVLANAEQQMQQAIRSSQQRVTQTSQLAQQQARQAAVVPPAQIAQAAQPPTPAPVQPPPSVSVEPTPVPTELVPPTPQNIASVENDLSATVARNPVRIPAELEEVGAPVVPPPSQPVQIPVELTNLQSQVVQAIEQAKAAAAQPVDFTIEANTEEFQQATSAAFDNARQLATENVEALTRAADQAAKESAEAFEAVFSAPTSERAAAITEARLKAVAAEQARASAEAADTFVSEIEKAAADARIRPLSELSAQRDIAALRTDTAEQLGQEEAAAAARFEAARFDSLASVEALKLQRAELTAELAQATGLDRERILAEIDNLGAAAQRARQQLSELQRQAVEPSGPDGGDGPDGRRSPFDAFTSIARGRSGGIGGLIGGAARFGLVGFAASAAFQAFGEIQQALRVTGDEAFTTEGKIRNLGAELLGGNLIGGIKAILAQEPAELTGGLQQAVDAFKQQLDDTNISLEQVLSLQRNISQIQPTEQERLTGGSAFGTFLQQQAQQGLISQRTATEQTREFGVETDEATDALKQYLAEKVKSGAIEKDQAVLIAETTVELAKQADAALKAATVWSQYAQAVTVGREAQDQFGLRGPGALTPLTDVFRPGEGEVGQVVGRQRTGIPRDIVTNPFENRVFEGQGGPEVAARIRESLNQRIRSEEERLQADLRSARIAQRTARENFAAAKAAADGSGAAADEYEKLVVATTGVANAAQAVKDQAARAAVEIQAAEDRIANARVSAIRDPDAQARAQLALDQAAQAREGTELEKARAAFAKKKISAAELKQAEAEYAEAVAATQVTQNQIADAQEAAAERARDSRLSAEQQSLENEIARAALTKRLSDDKEAFAAAIAYWKNLANEAGTAEEREAAQAKVIDLRERRSALLGGGGDLSGLRQLQLQNQLAAAQLAANIPQQRRAAEAIVKYWEGQVAALSGIQKAQAQASLIAARGTLRGVEDSAISVAEQRIQNRIQAARLTPDDLRDDTRAADALVAFWEKQVKDAVGADKVRKQASLIAARLARQALSDSEQATTTVFDLLTKTSARFADFAGNLRDQNNPFTRESFVGEVAQFFRPGVNEDDLVAGPSGFTGSLAAFRQRNERLGRIPGGGVEKSLDANTAATDRLTDAILNGPLARNDKRFGLTYGEVVGARWDAMGDFWKARQARQATEAGIGAAGAGFG